MDNLSNPQRRQAAPAASDFRREASGTGPGQRLMRFAGDFFSVSKGERSEQVAGYLTIMPAMFLILGLTLYPVGYSIWLSLLEKHSFFPQERFIGLENYIYLWSDPEFWSAFWLGLVYSFWTIVFQVILGVAAALILHETFIGRNLIRGIVLFPYMIPTIVAVILWKWLLNDTYGVVNYWLLDWGIVQEPISWLGADHIMLSTVVMSIWQFFPFVLLTILARLQTIPEKLYEAAKVDGASAFRRFIHITLPQIRGILFVVILLRSIWMFTKFDTVWLMGEGAGAGRFIRTLPVYAYMRTLTYYQAGLGAALAVIMFLILVVCTIVYFRMFREEADIG
ncbi:MAG: sugar ABC transporter permease [Deltaproteobacteria bacterium]|nr:sugar ABC transporter permease [Deltaproteobacteria bacterium]